MLTIDEKPANSAIEEMVDADSITLRWNQPSQPARSFLISYSVVVVSIVGWWELQHIQRFVQNQGNANSFWSLLLIWVFIAHLFHLIRLFQPMVPESVTLGSTSLRHDTGRAFFFSLLSRVRLPNGRRVVTGMTPRHICTIPISDLGCLVFARSGGRRTIFYPSGRLEIEVGQFLSEADREWLAGVLQAWRVAAAGT